MDGITSLGRVDVENLVKTVFDKLVFALNNLT